MELSIAKKGKDCVELARKVVTEMGQGGIVADASSDLQKLEATGTELAKQAEELAKRLAKVQEYNKEQEEEVQRQIGEYGRQEWEKQCQMNSAQSTLNTNRRILAENRTSLANAQDELSSAERRLSVKRREARQIRTGAAIGGALLGVFTGGIGGLIVGTSVGTVVGQAVNELVIKVDAARRTVGRRKRDCSNAQSAIETSERQISNISSQLSTLSSQKKELEGQKLEYHKKATQLREVISFLQETTTFWLMFKQLSDHSTNRTSLLQRIVEKAESEANPKILGLNASQRVAATVLDVWTEMEVSAENGRSRFSFAMQYKCSRCKETRNDLPYILEEEFLCHDCHSNAITD